MTSVFEADTDFERVGDQRFLAAVTDRWNGLHGQPLGGYVLAVALQTLRAQMPFPDLLASSAFFLRPVAAGTVEVRTEIVRGSAALAGDHGRCRLAAVQSRSLRIERTPGDLRGR